MINNAKQEIFMILDKGTIPDIQFIFLFIGYILGSSLLVAVSEYISMPNTWIVVIAALFIGIIIALIYSTLSNKFKTNSLIEINNIVYGKYIGTFISSIYLINLLLLTSLNIRFFGDFFVGLIMPETPLIVFCIMIAFVCASAVRNGIEVIARCSFILVILTVIEVISSSLMLIKDMKLSNFLPILDISLRDFMLSTNFLTFALFGETIVFMFIYPHLTKKSSIYKCTFIPIFIGAGIIELITIRNTSVLGKNGALYTYPSFEAVRLISIGKIFTRLELFFFITIILCSFIKISILYYAATLSVAKIFKLNSYTHLVYPLGIIFVCLSTIIFEYYGEQMNFGMITFPIMAFPIHIAIPLLSLIIANIRRL